MTKHSEALSRIHGVIEEFAALEVGEMAYVSCRYHCESDEAACICAEIHTKLLERWGKEKLEYLNTLSFKFMPIYLSYQLLKDRIDQAEAQLKRKTVQISPSRKRKHVAYVYVVQDNDGLVKIGCTDNIMTRLPQIQSAVMSKLRILHVIDCTKREEDGKALERILHEKFKTKRLKHDLTGKNREWFTLDQKEIDWIIKKYPHNSPAAIELLKAQLLM